MKRYFAMVLAVVLLCICTGAMAMGWGHTDNPPPTYTVTITKRGYRDHRQLDLHPPQTALART